MSQTFLAAADTEKDFKCTSSLCRLAERATDSETALKVVDYISAPLRIILILIVAWVTLRVVRRIIRKTVSGIQGDQMQRSLARIRSRTPRALQATGEYQSVRQIQRAETIGAVMRSLATVAVCLVAFFAILKTLDINLAPVFAGAGIATAALGFGAQNIVRDFLAGFFIVTEDQYGVGDVIDVGGAAGSVESVSLRITRLRDVDGTLWHVPNGEITSVANKSQQWARAVIDFRLDIGTDIPKAITVIKTEADRMWQDPAFQGILIEEPEVWGPEEVGPYGVLLKLAVKTKPLEQWSVSRKLRSQIKHVLDSEGIHIAPLPIAPQGDKTNQHPGNK